MKFPDCMKRQPARPARNRGSSTIGVPLRASPRALPSRRPRHGRSGFTLIELLAALLIFSLLALMSYRGLSAVLDTRRHIQEDSDKWRGVAAFFLRFGRDVHLAAPRPVRTLSGTKPAWQGASCEPGQPCLEFSRFASAEGLDTARRVAYRISEKQEIELWLWPALDAAPGTVPTRYTALAGVARLELRYLDAGLAWTGTWPVSQSADTIPRAVQIRIVLTSGEDIVRIFELAS